MNVGAYRGSRPEFYDRAPVQRTQYNSSSNAGGTAATTAWTYTVPAGKRAWLDFAMASTVKTTAAATPAYSQTYINYTPNGGSPINICNCVLTANTVWSNLLDRAVGVGMLQPGDTVTGNYYNGDTGGQVSQVSQAKITEYDA